MEFGLVSSILPVSGWVLAYAAVVGACIGSFLTLATYRLPREEEITRKRSHCPNCSTPLSARDLVPVISWAASRGRCRHCKVRVSARYPLTELACGIGTALIAWRYGVTLEGFAIAALWWSIVAIIITDLEHYIILDEVQIAVGVFGALHAYALQLSVEAVIGSAIMGGAIGLALKYGFLYFRNKDGLGMGDVKFLAVAGIWLGDAASFVPFLFFSGLLGVASGVLWRACKLGERFPFGPALALALLLCVVQPETARQFWLLYGILPLMPHE